MTRCPVCYRREDDLHRVLGRCPDQPAPPAAAPPQRGYVPPSRAHRVPRDEWRAQVRVSDEQKRANARARTARWRASRR